MTRHRRAEPWVKKSSCIKYMNFTELQGDKWAMFELTWFSYGRMQINQKLNAEIYPVVESL